MTTNPSKPHLIRTNYRNATGRAAPKRLSNRQRRDMLEIIHAVNGDETERALDLLSEAPDWFVDWPLWSAGENMPGYMPDSPYILFLTERAAIGYCRELERDAWADGYVSDYMPTSLREVLSLR